MTNRLLFALLFALLFMPKAIAETWDSTLYSSIENSIQSPDTRGADYFITDFGASPAASAAKNQKAIQKAIDKCAKKGGGRVVVSSGQRFQTGAIRLKSHVNLVVEEGATLQFVFQPELYPIVETSWEGLDCYNLSPCIYAFQATDVAITGQGTIDGSGAVDTWWPWCGADKFGWKEGMVSQKTEARPRLLQNGEDGVPMVASDGKPNPKRTFTATDGLRPQLVCLNSCQRVLLEDVTLLRSPFWVIHPLKCTDVTVRRVKMINDGPNGDGCDPESCDRVLIEDCFFNTGDDCIAIKSGRNRDGRERNIPSKNIIIRRCQMKNGHGGVVIGSEISGGCQNVFAHDCTMDSPNLDRVLRIKTNSCRGGIIENIYMRHIEVGQCGESVVKINLDYEHNEICCRGNYPQVRRVFVDDVTCRKSRYGVQIIGLNEDTFVSDIYVSNCRFDGVADGNTVTGKTKNVCFDNLFVNGSLVLQKKPYKHYSEWMTYSEMKRTPQSYLLDFSTRPKWSYVMGIELEGMLDTYLRYGGKEILNYCKLYTDTMIDVRGNIRGYNLLDYNLDNIRTGHFVTRMYCEQPEPKNLLAIQTLMKQLDKQPRTKADRVYWHKAIYAYQVWLDGIFMGLPFRALTASKLLKPQQATKIYDDAVDQLLITYQRTLDPATGLNRHAYDENRNMFWADPSTGLSQHCWGRAQGWYTMALIELLDAVPADYARRGELIELLRKDLDAVIKWQDKKTGLWYQVMDQPGREGNYLESTCSSMFAYALLKAFRKGYLGAQYREAGIKAYRGIIRHFIRVDADQTISLTHCCAVAGLGPGITPEVEAALKSINPKSKAKENKRRDGSYDYYLSEAIRDNDAKGLGPFIWASLEMEQLGFDADNVLEPIDRQAVVSRNNPVNTTFNPLSSLTVGNGVFATTVDVTGLQSYPFDYEAGVPLTAMSQWGWHSFENTFKLQPAESQRQMDLGHGHSESYAVEYKKADDGRRRDATTYFRVNPHRLNLGTIGLYIADAAGNGQLPISQLTDIRQELKLFDGIIESAFSADAVPFTVTTACLPDRDALLCRVQSPMLATGRAAIRLSLPYPTGLHSDAASDYNSAEKHRSEIVFNDDRQAVIRHTLNGSVYFISLRWQGQAQLCEVADHVFLLTSSSPELSFEAEYSLKLPAGGEQLVYDQQLRKVMKAWSAFWHTGGIVDFSACTDSRAPELERRVVLSQYLTQVNCGTMSSKSKVSTPPQETGLTYNSWFGRPHLEMTWWHMVDFALWNRHQTLSNVLRWYDEVAYPEARAIAQRQGFKGIRWMKMTDPEAGEAPSNTGSFLIWQQPHYIYMAEEMYRHDPSPATLVRHAEQVEQTAAFMADFVSRDKTSGQYYLTGATAMQESMSKDFSFCHPFELAYWQYGLSVAQKWRERQGLQRRPEWDAVIGGLRPFALECHDGHLVYAAGLPLRPFDSTARNADFDPFRSVEQEGAKEISENEFLKKSTSDHPAVLGAPAMLPLPTVHPLYSPETMRQTYEWVVSHWQFATTWGWDYGMMAMAAARLGMPAQAVDALFIDQPKNTYLPSGHNFQTADRLRLYLPGNGALLTAVAMMCAGWDGADRQPNPGFPANGTWNVRWEGLNTAQ